jgi:hypothetical protein
MKKTLFLFLLPVTMVSCSMAQKPTVKDITQAMKTIWEKPATTMEPKSTIDINSIKIGTTAKANYAQELDGIPKGAMVTYAKIDFTQNQFYTDGVHKVRRITTGLVYKDQFGDWTVMDAATTYPGN